MYFTFPPPFDTVKNLSLNFDKMFMYRVSQKIGPNFEAAKLLMSEILVFPQPVNGPEISYVSKEISFVT